MSRRDFLFTASAAATTLLVLQGCTDEASDSAPGGRYEVPPEAGRDSDAARSALAGDEFVFDLSLIHI